MQRAVLETFAAFMTSTFFVACIALSYIVYSSKIWLKIFSSYTDAVLRYIAQLLFHFFTERLCPTKNNPLQIPTVPVYDRTRAYEIRHEISTHIIDTEVYANDIRYQLMPTSGRKTIHQRRRSGIALCVRQCSTWCKYQGKRDYVDGSSRMWAGLVCLILALLEVACRSM
ncbi:hypothetical protein CPC08DRAFT_71016 [Agrocybe pediades]|nr:hypothetical protein CPC08DRAFT_71016 [Agrocybe pediades]